MHYCIKKLIILDINWVVPYIESFFVLFPLLLLLSYIVDGGERYNNTYFFYYSCKILYITKPVKVEYFIFLPMKVNDLLQSI